MEFFPPKTDDGLATLRRTVDELEPLDLSFVSVTYGAGGSTRDRTRDLVVEHQPGPALPGHGAPHLHGPHPGASWTELLADYDANGVHNILALAGDPPADGSPVGGDFTYARRAGGAGPQSHGDHFAVGVAAHPELHPRSTDRAEDRRHLARKLESADFGITQFFFDADDYFRMVDELAALGCTTPVHPGRHAADQPGRRAAHGDDGRRHLPGGAGGPGGGRGRRATGHGSWWRPPPSWPRRLLDGGVPGLHLYCLNRSPHRAGGRWRQLGLRRLRPPPGRPVGTTFLPARPAGMRRGSPGADVPSCGLGRSSSTGTGRWHVRREAKARAQGRGPARRRSVRFDGADEAALAAQIRAWVATDRKRLGEVLLELGAIDPDDLIGALSRQREVGGGVPAGPDGSDPNAPAPDAAARLGRLLVDQGVITEVDLAAALAEQFGMPLADLRTVSPEQAAIDRVPEELARKHGVIPLRVEDEPGVPGRSPTRSTSTPSTS